MSATSLSVRLKEDTKTNHQLLEKQIILLIRSIHSPKDYAGLLLLFYTFFGGAELLVDKVIDRNTMPDYLQRRKTASLLKDLQQLKIAAQPFATTADLPMIKNNLQAVGAMYVMEGSTLGGQYISKMIIDQLPTENNMGFDFFNSYQQETQRMWLSFKIAIDRILLSTEEETIVITAANDMFICFSNWMKE